MDTSPSGNEGRFQSSPPRSRPTPEQLAKTVRQRFRDGARLWFTAHAANERLAQRGLVQTDVEQIFLHGHPYRVGPGAYENEWKVNFALRMKNGRDAAAVFAVSRDSRERIPVLTVMWLDRSSMKSN